MQLGEFTLTTINGGRYRADGGTIFGVVPKALWNRALPADDHNMVPQAAHCVLVQGGGRTVLIDTGYGSKLNDKYRRLISAEAGDPLLESLQQHGVAASDVDTVILSHLHFDHAGGCTSLAEDGRLVPTFPNAEYVVQRREWTIASAEYPELAAAYPLENFLPLKDTGQLRLLDGDGEIMPGIHAEITGGHTEAHQMLIIESQGQTAVFIVDLCPTSRHLAPNWHMSYDVDPLQTRRKKPQVLGRIADAGWLALWTHDPDHAAARLERTKRGDVAVAERVEVL